MGKVESGLPLRIAKKMPLCYRFMNQPTIGKDAFGTARFRYTICPILYSLTRPGKISHLSTFKSSSLLTISSAYPEIKPALKIIRQRKLADSDC